MMCHLVSLRGDDAQVAVTGPAYRDGTFCTGYQFHFDTISKCTHLYKQLYTKR